MRPSIRFEEYLSRNDRRWLRSACNVWVGAGPAVERGHRSPSRGLHGDLHPRNVLVQDGALAGIIDWGDVTAGDVATDLACTWMLFDFAHARELFLEAYAPSEQVRARAVGWVVHFASGLIDSGEPRHVLIGISIMRRLAGADE